MKYEFSKSEKKIVRQVIETGLQRDFESCILDIDQIIQQWKSKKLDNRAAYHKIFGKVKANDKYIARMYDDLRGSTYMMVLQGLLANKTITEADLGGFSETTRNAILNMQSTFTFAIISSS
ncbi:MAG: hypothetical protein Q8M08_16025 [Bacteroidales bacterium]|nr:hypothetical protein [Bacteroidales bacterium]